MIGKVDVMRKIFWTGCLALFFTMAFPEILASPQNRLRISTRLEADSKVAAVTDGTQEDLSFAVVIAGSLFVLLIAWPTSRAWLYVLSGNYDEAIRIYEEKITRRPSHLRLYLTLANVYLLAGRNDQRALTAYTVMRLLHLASHNVQNGVTAIAVD